jgi:hypothetical protein
MIVRRAPSVHLLLGGVLMLSAGCAAAPRSFTPSEPLPPDQVSHRLLDEVLQAHVRDGLVDYPGIAQDARFRAYLSHLTRVDPSALATRDDRLAFWINAYNAYAIQGILEGGSPGTLWGRYMYFIRSRYRVGGGTINLYDLEREVLVKEFREPRIHFAIVCASRSCPKLRSEAYQAPRLTAQLEESARAFINDPARNRFDRTTREARLSKIFGWFEEDFVARSGSVTAYVRQYVSDETLARDLGAEPYSVEFLPYDWSLNGPSPSDSSPL